MAIDDFLPIPNSILHVIAACTLHPCVVTKCGDPKCCSDVRVKCASLWDDKESNWVPRMGIPSGSNEKGKSHTGTYKPSRPGEFGVIGFYAGNPLKPYYIPNGASMSEPGSAGNV